MWKINKIKEIEPKKQLIIVDEEKAVKKEKITKNNSSSSKEIELELELENNKFSKRIIEKLKEFENEYLAFEQNMLLSELIPDEKLRNRYKQYGLCQECHQPNTGKNYFEAGWCQLCNSKRFQGSFKNWTSGNLIINEFIQKCQLEATNDKQIMEWIPYEQFTDVKYIAEGGFGKVYKAKWFKGEIFSWNTKGNKWDRAICSEVVLKKLKNSRNITTDFLKEIANHNKFTHNYLIARCLGISQDPETKDYIMVMHYMKGGNLRQYSIDQLEFYYKLTRIRDVAKGLSSIHDQKLIHRDLHAGNILNQGIHCYITDLGLCRPANETDKTKVFGVLPYVAPEVLKGQSYTQASDIYSFGMVAYEIVAGKSPYYEHAYNEWLAIQICKGLRPNLNETTAPRLLKDLIKQCWDEDPLKRPTAFYLKETLSSLFTREGFIRKDTEFYNDYKEIEEMEKLSEEICIAQNNFQTAHTSRLLNFKNLPEPQNSQEINNEFYNSKNNIIPQSIKFNIDELDDMLKNSSISGQEEELTDIKVQIQIPPKNN